MKNKTVLYETHQVVITPLVEDLGGEVNFIHAPSVIELLEFIGDMPIKDQVYMLCNLLTISGFTQAEVADALGVAFQTYRNRLWEIRKDFVAKGINDF